MDYTSTAAAILKNIGGKENVKSVVHCATRLRFSLYDSSIPNTEAIMGEKGILQVITIGGQYQIVIGPTVPKLYNEVIAQGGFNASAAVSDPAAAKADRKLKFKLFFEGLFSSKKTESENGKVYSPASGSVIPLSEVKDEAFSSGVLGEGLAIVPAVGKIFAPVSGVVTTLPSSGHAVGIEADDGAEILIHVGMDTVSLKGEGFSPAVKEGARVKKGQLLVEFDIGFIKSKGLSTVTPIVITNSDSYKLTILANNADAVDNSSLIISYK